MVGCISAPNLLVCTTMLCAFCACSATPAANTHAVNRVLCNFMIVILLIFISQFSFPTQNALEHPGR